MIKQVLATLLFLGSISAAADNAARDLSLLNKARQAYGQKKYIEAVAIYSTVPKTSDYWPMAVEERAHTHGKLSEFSKTIADLTTLRNPIFEDSLTAEAYFTEALTYLRLCQYKKVYQTAMDFKSKMKPRVVALVGLKDRGQDAMLERVALKLRAKGLSTKNYAKDIKNLPLLFQHDTEVKKILTAKNFGQLELSRLSTRLATLADQDLNEVGQNLDKMQLIEAEVMQNLYSLEKTRGSDRSRTGGFRSDSGDMVFPYDGEVWIDELDSYQVKARKCPKASGA